MKLAALNEHAAAARVRVDALEQELAAAYLKALRTAGRKAASRFRGAASLAAPSLTAATDPKWVPPDPGALLDQQQLAAQAKKNAAPVQERALRLAVPVGISFDIANPLAQGFLAGLADRSNRILEGFSGEIGAAISQAHEQGLSIPKAAQLIRARVESASQVEASLLARSDLVSIANGGSLLAAQIVAAASADAGEAGPVGKTWLTAGDERVRDTHAEADGQTVPLDQPFDVGGESLMYPGDPDGSLEETANCRCTQIYGDSLTAAVRAPTPALSSRVTMDETLEVTAPPLVLRDFHLTAAAGEPTRWQATLLVEDERTEDGRMIAADATTWRGLPLPLMATDVTADGHDGAELCGRIDQIWRAGRLIQAAGIFNDMAEDPESRAFAADIVQKVRDRLLTGVSVDPVGCDVEIVVSQRAPAEDEDVVDEVAEVIGEPVYEEPAIFEDDLDYLQVYTSLVLGGATICPFQAVANAQIEIVAGAEMETRPFITPFNASASEITAAERAADSQNESAGDLLDRAIIDTARMTAAMHVEANSEQVAAVAASAANERETLRQEIAAVSDAVTRLAASVKELGPAVLAMKRDLADRLASVESQQTASLTASGATVEGLEELGRRLDSLDTLASDLERLRDLVERKPRQVEFKRDNQGRLAGLVEG